MTGELADAMSAHHVLDSPQAMTASDHLPVTVEYQPAAIDD